jgi:uncharacterized protein YjdB
MNYKSPKGAPDSGYGIKLAVLALIPLIAVNPGCSGTGTLSNLNLTATTPKNNQGPNSVGGVFRLTDKNGNGLPQTRFSLLAQQGDNLNKLAEASTDNNGEAEIPGSIISPEIINALKNNTVKLVLKAYINDQEITLYIKNIEFESDKLIKVIAQNEAPKALEVKVSQKSINIVAGKTAEISAEVIMSDGSKGTGITWSSSDEAIATVSKGKISALKKGAAIITAASSLDLDIYNKIAVTVIDEAAVSTVKIVNSRDKTVVESPLTLKTGNSFQLEAIVVLTDGTTSGNVVWRSTDESVLVAGKNSGIITGITPGKATVTASSTLDLSKSITLDVEVIP